jgi:hypothetical protein
LIFGYFGCDNRPRADQGHLAAENIPKLREFVQASLAQQEADSRDANTKFKELRSWYLFASRFCNVARGNEKGQVENLVKRSQRTFLTPLPEVTDLSQLNAQLQACCREESFDADAWNLEQQALLPLAADPYPACREQSSFVDKQSLVHIANHSYSVPVAWAHWPCVVKAFVEHVEVWCQQQLVARHPRSHDDDKFMLEPMHYIPLLERKPGCLDQARPFKGNPWGDDFLLLRTELEYRYGDDGTRQFIGVLLLFKDHDAAEVRSAVSGCVRRRVFNEQAVRNALQSQPVVPPPKGLDLFNRPELRDVGKGIRPASIYDQLNPHSQVKEIR